MTNMKLQQLIKNQPVLIVTAGAATFCAINFVDPPAAFDAGDDDGPPMGSPLLASIGS